MIWRGGGGAIAFWRYLAAGEGEKCRWDSRRQLAGSSVLRLETQMVNGKTLFGGVIPGGDTREQEKGRGDL